MRIAVLQYPIVWGDVHRNVALTIERIAALVGQTDVVLLPEMFSTGFCVDRPELAEPVDGYTLTTLQHTADTYGVAIAGTFICRAGDKLFNRGFLLSPHAEPQFNDKRHLYATGGEDLFFTPGTKRTVFTYQGVKMLMLICYDVRFPVWARNVWGNDYDIIIVSANWPEARVKMWDILVASRAVENQCYVVAANLVGDDGAGWHYNGHSVAYDTRMNELLGFADNEQGTRIADLSIPALKHYREALPLWRDTDRTLIRPMNNS
ncbi:MAG: nitrilase family protein [Paludibacteraceae bacterium]|nr:nitrilase family protein [Paludibacteraceae bacterium]